jgi:AraC-like DNA-binding protein
MWEEAAELSSDDDFGLHLAESTDPSTFGLFSYLAVSSATWGFALNSVCTYFGLLSDASGYDIVDAGERVIVAARPWPGVPILRQVTEFSLAVLVCYGRRHLSNPLACAEVSLPYPAPSRATEHERIFSAPVRFDADSAGFSFARHFLDVALVSADGKLANLLQPSAVAELARVASSTTPTIARVEPVLQEAVRSGVPTLDDVARRLAASPRTLQRQLAAEGTSFRELVGRAQGVFAAELLLKPELGVSEVAAILGFSDGASFHRSFNRWMGMTTTQYRRERASSR